MSLYKKILFVGIVLLFLTSTDYAQRKATPRKKQSTPVTQKATDSRLTPPTNRKFNHSFELTSDYDKFENTTKVQLRIPINSVETMYLVFSFNGEKIKQAPKQILFQYFGNSSKFFLPVKDFVVLTDRDRLRIKIIQLPELDNGKIPFAAVFDYPTFLRIANGESVEMKIGETELIFDDESLEALKDFASRTNPKNDRSAEITEAKGIGRQVKDEAAKLLRLTPKVKAEIKETLEKISLLQQGVKKAITGERTDEEFMSLTLDFGGELLQDGKNLPDGLLKRLILDSILDTISSHVIYGTRAGIFSQSDPNYKPLLEAAVKKYNLTDYAEKEQPSILLSNAEQSLYHAQTLAAAAKIIEIN